MTKKHIGNLPSGSRCFVLMNSLSENQADPEYGYCLIVEPDTLPEQYSYAVNDAILGPAQKVDMAVEVLSKTTLSNGIPIINLLHKGNYIRKVATSSVTLDLGNGATIKLSDLSDQLSIINAENKTAVDNVATTSANNHAQNLINQGNKLS